MSDKKKVLGRGLNALLAGDTDDTTPTNDVGKTAITNQAGVVIYIPLEQIEVNPFQPRTTFDENSLAELSDSIKIHGVIQPITVRKIENNKFQLIAGERRLRASQKAGKKEIPAYVRTASDQESIEIALIENIQREDLNPLEIAINYKRLMDECEITQEKLSERLGKNRSSVTNFLRLLKLPPDLQAGLRDEKITMGHAKALLGLDHLPSLLEAYKEVIAKNLSVRQTEELIKTYQESKKKTANTITKKPEADIHLKKVEADLSTAFGTKVIIHKAKDGKGEINIKFFSDNDLNRLLDLLQH